MQKVIRPVRYTNDFLISFAVLAFLLVFTHGLFFVAPYPGFYFNPTNGTVLDIYDVLDPDPASSLAEGDIIKQVGAIQMEEYLNDPTVNLFENFQRGDIVDIVIQRGSEEMTISWVFPGFTRTGFLSRFINIWWLAYIFWGFGAAAQLLMRPKSKRWLLFLISSYATGMFIILGSLSAFHIWHTPVLTRVVAWLAMPVYLHFHWIFPHSLKRIPIWLQIVFYGICCVLAIGELLLLVPKSLYFVTVILAFGGSFLLLIVHFILQPEHRREVRFLAGAAFTAFFPLIFASAVLRGEATPPLAPLALVVLPVLPGAYFYVLFRSNLGILELRTNRAISINIFLILIATVLILTIGYLGSLVESPEEFFFVTIIIAMVTALLGAWVFPSFQKLVERRILGIKLPNQNLAETYSARIVTSDSLPVLLKLLRDEVFPSLLIRQYAFVRNLKTSAEVILSENVTQDQVPHEALDELLASFPTGNLSAHPKQTPPLDWVHLTLPLRLGPDLIGLWLLGRRDPDDHYSQAELPTLQSLANQTAVALSNIIQTEHLKSMYDANINRYEQERGKLARDLHDSVLNEMAVMKMELDPSAIPPEFQTSYDELINRVREIVGDLRPPMLLYGLKFALNGLADNLSDRHRNKLEVIADIEADGEPRYPEIVEQNLYRIVQEACENASKYARAKSIRIEGRLSEKRIEIEVTDDGIGFRDEVSLKLDDMLANKHFGLAGMHERADLIGAEIRIHSKPGQGTQIHVIWELKDSI